MPTAIALLMIALGCAPASFSGPAGGFVVWVCPPVQPEAATGADVSEERES